MNIQELKTKIQEYQYLEDTNIVDVAIASIIANRLRLGNPIWMLIIGASSGGKSQILRPLSLTDETFMFRVDDLTENTLLSGAKLKDGESASLLDKMGAHAMMVISDLTVIMSKSGESRATILSQFRMLYDGEMTKFSGNSSKAQNWEGYMGVLAASTPSVYSHFEEVADMGERFIYYRMKEFDQRKATELALSRSLYGKKLDKALSSHYGEYIESVSKNITAEDLVLPPEMKQRIIEVSMFAERVRTVAHKDWSGKVIDRIPTPAMPMRVALQLTSIAMGLGAMRIHDCGELKFTDDDYSIIDWLGYSLANEENRAVLKVLASVDFENTLTSSTLADKIGLDTSVVGNIAQNLSAVGILKRDGGENYLMWKFSDKSYYDIVRRIEHMTTIEKIENRKASVEDGEEYSRQQEHEMNNFDWDSVQ